MNQCPILYIFVILYKRVKYISRIIFKDLYGTTPHKDINIYILYVYKHETKPLFIPIYDIPYRAFTHLYTINNNVSIFFFKLYIIIQQYA